VEAERESRMSRLSVPIRADATDSVGHSRGPASFHAFAEALRAGRSHRSDAQRTQIKRINLDFVLVSP
jgi:hypothetical protein